MSDADVVNDAVERLEWDEAKQEAKHGASPHTKWNQVTRRAALTGGAAGIAALALEACGGSSSSSSAWTASPHGGRRRQRGGRHLRGSKVATSSRWSTT